ncbi:MAG: GHMP kinase [Acidobacteria bacterium]|nr:MAG: GHMP kinase [Acidobacteriota bacterium]
MLIRAKGPLRISFAGGGTDVKQFFEQEGGCVLNATIGRYVWGTLRSRKDGLINIESADLGYIVNYDTETDPVYDGKLDLVKAGIRSLGGHGSAGFDLLLHSEAPAGSGLGSSSTLMVCLVGLMKEFLNLPMTDYETARAAYQIEREELQIKGGLQDHYAATFGGFNFMEFEKNRVIVNPLRVKQEVINELELNLVLCYTGSTRMSDGIIKDQVCRYENRVDQTLHGLRRQKQLAVEMKNALMQRRLDDFGELLDEAWQSKKMFSPKISNPRIDEMYESARKAGAIGGKVTGAGGGGYMLFYCRFESKHRVAEALAKLGGIPTGFAFEFNGLQTWRVDGNLASI